MTGHGTTGRAEPPAAGSPGPGRPAPPPGAATITPARPADARALADLHRTRITEGFLPRLGPGFLRRLYRRMTRSADCVVLTARDGGRIVGFAAGATDLGALYRRFLLRDGPVAAMVAAPRLVRHLPQVLETLRYEQAGGDAEGAEVLSVAVAADAAGRGLGRALVSRLVVELAAHGVAEVRVVTGASNAAALAVYRACGFRPHRRLEVHAGTVSEQLVWRPAPS